MLKKKGNRSNQALLEYWATVIDVFGSIAYFVIYAILGTKLPDGAILTTVRILYCLIPIVLFFCTEKYEKRIWKQRARDLGYLFVCMVVNVSISLVGHWTESWNDDWSIVETCASMIIISIEILCIGYPMIKFGEYIGLLLRARQPKKTD